MFVSMNFFFIIPLAEQFGNRKQVVNHINFPVPVGNI